MEEQSQSIAVPQALPQAVEKALMSGDLRGLTPEQRLVLYRQTCESLGLNPLTNPFSYLELNGKLVLYATRNCTDQLRHLYHISLEITKREVMEDLYIVSTKATGPDGRFDEKMGVVCIANLQGEKKANALMKCETKSGRRVTLSICGLSLLDETEVESIPAARVFQEPGTTENKGAEHHSQDPDDVHPTAEQVNELINLAMTAGHDIAKFGDQLRARLDLSGDVKLTKKFMRESLNMTHYGQLWAYYQQMNKEYVEKDILDVAPPAAPQSYAITSGPLPYQKESDRAVEPRVEGEPFTLTEEIDEAR